MLRKTILTLALAGALTHSADGAADNIDGTIDPSYGDAAGRSTQGFLESDQPQLRAIARSPFDRYWLFGDDPVDVGAAYLTRISTAGVPDAGFGTNGTRRTPIGLGFAPGAPALSVEGGFVQADGKALFFGGLTAPNGTAGAYPGLLCRVAAAGNLDAGFGTNGCRPLRTFLVDDETCRVTDAELAPDGSFIAIGNCAGPALPSRAFIARVTAGGTLDAEFGAGAGLITPILPGAPAGGQYFKAVSIRPDGTFVVLAQVEEAAPGVGTERDIAVASFDGGGSFDGSFGGGDGAVSFGFDLGGADDDRPVDIDVGADGRILVLAQSTAADSRRAVAGLAQLTPAGALDATFDGDGLRVDALGGELGALSSLRDVEFDADGKIVAGGSIDVPGEDVPSAGTRFWIALPGSVPPSSPGRVMVNSEVRTSGVLDAPGVGLSIPFEVVPGKQTQIAIPFALDLDDPGEATTQEGILIRTRDPVAVHAESGRTFALDTSVAQPVDTLGTTFRVLGWNIGLGAGSFYAIVATEDGTSVTITPSATGAGNGRAAGVPYVVQLQRGSTYRFTNAAAGDEFDTSGTLIQSTKPIAVYSGHTCANIPSASIEFCEALIEQETPVSRWGTEFLYAKQVGRTAGDIVRILAHEDGTVVSANGGVVANLSAGQFFQATFTEPRRITANKPIDVHQYSVGCKTVQEDPACPGDPSMVELVPTSRWRHRWMVGIPAGLQGNPVNYVQVISPTASRGTVRIDGTPIDDAAWAQLLNSGYSRAAVAVAEGQHLVTAQSPIVAYAHGVGSSESFAHAGASAPGGAWSDTDDVLLRLLPDGARDGRFGIAGVAAFDHAPGLATDIRSVDRMTNLIVDREAITVGTGVLNRNSDQSLFGSYRVLGSELFSDSFE